MAHYVMEKQSVMDMQYFFIGCVWRYTAGLSAKVLLVQGLCNLLTLAIRYVVMCYFVQLRIAKVKRNLVCSLNST